MGRPTGLFSKGQKGARMDEAIIRQITGEDVITVSESPTRKLYRNKIPEIVKNMSMVSGPKVRERMGRLMG